MSGIPTRAPMKCHVLDATIHEVKRCSVVSGQGASKLPYTRVQRITPLYSHKHFISFSFFLLYNIHWVEKEQFPSPIQINRR
ncbi:hypothetical protein QVD17_30037 [Tagetes erecta]|uniref:Uncharacterized protein n=1 Tax=Tagetes erecta TaxID=13708 RepID=A0AAD8K2T1_TARER|nr:hypothetical protein QVD17_30037 [Tagetes erecta]